MPAGRGHHELTKRYCRECGKPLKYSSTRKNDMCASCNGGNKKKPSTVIIKSTEDVQA